MAGWSADRREPAVHPAPPHPTPAEPQHEESPALASRRTLERATAVGVCAAGAIVAAESLTHDIGWNETGPGPGYFPFRIGLLLAAAGLALLIQQRRASPAAPFTTAARFARVWSVFWPTVALAGAMFPLGCYTPSAAYLAWMMRRHGGYGWLRSIGGALVFIIAFYAIFDLWFRVPLAKGPLETALGLY